ncbi:MAG: response regulator [Promethearchaeota archaeon]|nr:MAG: response regulator [Candidatus Lokiarchaeota archaeon]
MGGRSKKNFHLEGFRYMVITGHKENSSINSHLCGFLWIRPSGVPYFKWFSAESFDESWNTNDLFFSGFFSAIFSSSEVFFAGDSLKYIEFNNFKIFSGKINAGDMFVMIARHSAPETLPIKLLNRMLNLYMDSQITAMEEIRQDSGNVEEKFLQILAEMDSQDPNEDNEPVTIPQNRVITQRKEANESTDAKDSKYYDRNQQILKIRELEKKLSSFTNLGRTIGHTLNNVLSTILGNVTLAKLDVPKGSDIFQSIIDAEESCERARILTSQLLNISKTIQSHESPELVDSHSPNNSSSSDDEHIIQRSESEDLILGEGRILILDDDPYILETASRMINRLGYEVEAVQELPAALKTYKLNMRNNHPFNAVILDLSEIGGLGEFGALVWQKIDPDIKAIISSGFSRDPIFKTYKDFGYRGVLKKPYNLKELGIVLNSVITNPSVGI